MILLGLIELAGGHHARPSRLIDEAQREFEKVGFRLGVAECEVARGHIHHREGELREAIERGTAARQLMQDLGNPRGEAACQRLLGMAL